jgi:alpha-L-rhamnosidase
MYVNNLRAGRKDTKTRVELLPKNIIWKQGEVTNEEFLLEERSLQISLEPRNPVVMRSSEKKAAVLLDFGHEIHGGIRILVWNVASKSSVKLRVRFGESVMEAMSELGGDTNATNDHARRDMEVELGMMSMNPIGETGFRFVRIDLEEDAVLLIKSITAIAIYKEVPYRGSFQCSDELLNRIWNVGAYTVHLNMQDYIWDGIKRDRLVWVGDMHPETMTIWTVFGEDDAVERSLEFIRLETPLPGWMNGLATYSIWYLIIVSDWFMHTGKLEWLREQQEYLTGIYEQLSVNIDEDGKNCVKDGRFLDWPSNDRPIVTDAGIQAMHYIATHKMEKIFTLLGDKEKAAQCVKDMERLKQYKTNYEDSKQAAALLVLAGLKDAKTVNEELLKVDGAAGMSTFMGYYILSARAMAGDYQGSLDCIRDYWGGMLSLGATTFWEDFDMEWMKQAAPIDRLPREGEVDIHGTYGRYCYQGYRHSLCHGWAAGATPWLTENVLGVKVLEPGCREVSITPHLGDLDWAEGTFPTPYGEISIVHKKQKDGSIQTKVKAPKEVKVVTAQD